MHIQLRQDYSVPFVVGTSWFLVPSKPCSKQIGKTCLPQIGTWLNLLPLLI